MKIKIAAFFFLYLFFASSLSADYSKMNREFKEYIPPEYYTNSLAQKSEGETPPEKTPMNQTGTEPDGEFNSMAGPSAGLTYSQVEDLKIKYNEKINSSHENLFLSIDSQDTYDELARISLDTQRVKKRVGDGLNLREIEIFTSLRNPAVLAAKKKVQARLESFSQVLDLDANLKQYSAFTEGINNKAGPLKMKESMKQNFPFPGLTALKGRIIQQQVDILVERMAITQKNVVTDTRKAFWDLLFTQRSIGITSEMIDAFNRLKDIANTLYRSGKTSFQDIIKINIRIEILKEERITLSSKKRNIEVKLKELLNIAHDSTLGGVIFIEPYYKVASPEPLYAKARLMRQELKVIRHQIAKVENMIEMSESMILEPFTLGLSTFEDEAVNSIGSGAAKPSFPEKTMATMKNNRPAKAWYGIDDPWLNQTRQNLAGLKQTLVEKENATDRMVRNAWFNSDKNLRELRLYKDKILPLSKSALDVSTREYESGSIPFSQAIGSYTYWLKVKLTIARKKTDLGTAVANLERVIGSSFR
jgi:cobalt-zinc-cadmium efflux system outer membrane protein